MCGSRIPDLENKGLKFSHILSKGSKGGNQEKNILALCHHCEHAFDKVLKPAIYAALTEFNDSKVPEDWN
ncbi:MAG: hypothetical protein Q7I98_05105 [Erysipelotrichaceae bacterium]|nr:hypothetical protein [Erysipelotrichaceae bacterium]